MLGSVIGDVNVCVCVCFGTVLLFTFSIMFNEQECEEKCNYRFQVDKQLFHRVAFNHKRLIARLLKLFKFLDQAVQPLILSQHILEMSIFGVQIVAQTILINLQLL